MNGLQEDLLQEGLSKGMRRAKRKTGDGSQDLDSSYNTDGDEAWPGPSLTDGIIDGQAAKRPKLTGTQTASRRPASAKVPQPSIHMLHLPRHHNGMPPPPPPHPPPPQQFLSAIQCSSEKL